VVNKKIGVGTLSLLLSIIGIIWPVTFKGGFCIGDNVLNLVGMSAWSNGDSGMRTHYTVFYSLLFFVLAIILSYKYADSFGAKIGRVLSMIIVAIFILSMFGLAV